MIIKLVFFGPKESGKTQLLNGWLGQEFSEMYAPTAIVNLKIHRINKSIEFHIRDLRKKKQFFSVQIPHYRRALIGLCSVDLSVKPDKDQINKNIDKFRTLNPRAEIVLIGTKADKASDEHQTDLEAIAQALRLPYIVTSAKNKLGFAELDRRIVEPITKVWEPLQINLNRARELTKKLYNTQNLNINTKLDELQSALESGTTPIEIISYIDKSLSQFQQRLNNDAPSRRQQIAKLVAVMAISAIVGLLGFAIGFGVGLLAGAWAGPAGFITALAAGSTVAYLAATAAVPGTVLGSSGAMIAHCLFKKSQITIKEKLTHQLEEIKQNFPARAG